MSTRRQLLFGAFLSTPPVAKPPAALEQLPTSAPCVIAFAEHCLAFQNVVCRSCGEACQEQAIRFSPRLGGAALPSLLAERCTGCGDCLPICPNAALSLTSAAPLNQTPEELCA